MHTSRLQRNYVKTVKGTQHYEKYDSCIRCGSQNIDRLRVNSGLSLNYPEEKHCSLISQQVLYPTDAIVCKECGHIEFIIDWEKGQN